MSTVVLRCGDAPIPIPLSAADVAITTAAPIPDETVIDSLSGMLDIDGQPRLIVLGGDAGLAVVLTRLMRIERLDIPIGYVPVERTEAARLYRTGTGAVAAGKALRGTPKETPLMRDDTGTVLVGRAVVSAAQGNRFDGEAYLDDNLLFRGRALRVQVTANVALPGLSARAQLHRYGRRSWTQGRALQLGSSGAMVIHNSVAATRPRTRVAFYRHHIPWLLPR